MKIGFIFECGPQGADKQVCEYLTRELCPDAEIIPRTLDNKANLLRDAGKTTKALLADGCERVLIVWDLRPAWPDKKKKPCRKEECDALRESLQQAGIAEQPVFLVCIEQELESWLLADEKKISAYLSTDSRPYKANICKHPDRVANPKSVMMNHFREARGWRYEDRIHAIKVLRAAVTDLNKLRRSLSFQRFEHKLTSH